MAEVGLVALSLSPPVAGPAFDIIESHGVQRWRHIILRPDGGDVGDAPLAMRATLEMDVPARNDARPSCTFIQLGTPTAAIEEAFSRSMRHSDMARAMRLSGALSARRYRLEQLVGRCDWELLTIYDFEGEDAEGITRALVDSSDVWEGDPSCIVMRVEPLDLETEQA